MRFLHHSSRGCALASGFRRHLFPWCFTADRFAGSLLCMSVGIETSLLTLVLLWLEEALSLESEGG